MLVAAAAAPHHPSTSWQSPEGSSRRSRRSGSSSRSSSSRMSRVAGFVAAAATALIAATVLAPTVANAQVTALHEPANGQVLFGAWLQTECVHCCCHVSESACRQCSSLLMLASPFAPLLARFLVDAATPGMLALLLSPDPTLPLARADARSIRRRIASINAHRDEDTPEKFNSRLGLNASVFQIAQNMPLRPYNWTSGEAEAHPGDWRCSFSRAHSLTMSMTLSPSLSYVIRCWRTRARVPHRELSDGRCRLPDRLPG